MAIKTPPRARPRTAPFDGTYEVLSDVDLPNELAEKARQLIEQADSERDEAHVTLRWGKRQLDIVRRAARLTGVPYQTYLKQASMQRAIEDLRAAREAGIELS
jgi:predicted DNA binding CopG/RHH family protein